MHKEPFKKSNSNNGPKIVKRPQPRGRQGVKKSLSEIVSRVEVGRMDPKTVAWSRETIVNANLGGFGANKMAQAKAILERLRKERPYIEDPVDGEFMPSAACTLEGCEGLTFLGEDCDGLVIAYLSAIESVGIEGALVAHSYDATKEHTHVLAAVFDESRGVWVRCDPSTSDPFGVVSTPTRETFFAIPGGHVLGDRDGVLDAAKLPRGSVGRSSRSTGDFVGVGTPKAEPGLTGITDSFREYMLDEVRRITQDLADSWYDTKLKHRQLELVCQMMEVPITGSGWTESNEEYFKEMDRWIPKMIQYGWEVSTEKRLLTWDQEENTTVLLGRAGEPFVGMTDNGHFMVRDTSKDAPEPSGSVGYAGYVIAGVVVVVVGSAFQYLMTKEACDTVRRYIDSSTMSKNQGFVQSTIDKLVGEGMSPKEAAEAALKMQTDLNRDAREQAKTEVEKEKVSPFTSITKTADKALSALTIIAIGGAVVYGISVLADMAKKKKAVGA